MLDCKPEHILLVKDNPQSPKKEANSDIETNFQSKVAVAQVPLEENEPISNATFQNIIDEAAKKEQAVIIARIQTRDKADFRKKYFHFFYGPNLIKLLFKKLDLN